MEDIKTEQIDFDKETDLVIQITHKNSERRQAQEMDQLVLAVQSEATQYRQHLRAVRKRFHVCNQIGMMMSGVCAYMAVERIMAGGGWFSLLYVCIALSIFAFSVWCDMQSRRKK